MIRARPVSRSTFCQLSASVAAAPPFEVIAKFTRASATALFPAFPPFWRIYRFCLNLGFLWCYQVSLLRTLSIFCYFAFCAYDLRVLHFVVVAAVIDDFVRLSVTLLVLHICACTYHPTYIVPSFCLETRNKCGFRLFPLLWWLSPSWITNWVRVTCTGCSSPTPFCLLFFSTRLLGPTIVSSSSRSYCSSSKNRSVGLLHYRAYLCMLHCGLIQCTFDWRMFMSPSSAFIFYCTELGNPYKLCSRLWLHPRAQAFNCIFSIFVHKLDCGLTSWDLIAPRVLLGPRSPTKHPRL